MTKVSMWIIGAFWMIISILQPDVSRSNAAVIVGAIFVAGSMIVVSFEEMERNET
jgi:hypothetical protein